MKVLSGVGVLGFGGEPQFLHIDLSKKSEEVARRPGSHATC